MCLDPLEYAEHAVAQILAEKAGDSALSKHTNFQLDGESPCCRDSDLFEEERPRARTLSEWWLEEMSTQRWDPADGVEDIARSTDTMLSRARSLSEWYEEEVLEDPHPDFGTVKSATNVEEATISKDLHDFVSEVATALTYEDEFIEHFRAEELPLEDVNMPEAAPVVVHVDNECDKDMLFWDDLWEAFSLMPGAVIASFSCSR